MTEEEDDGGAAHEPEMDRLRDSLFEELAALREPAGEALVEVASKAACRVSCRHEACASGGECWDYAVGNDESRAILDAVLPRLRAEGWQPIATAPGGAQIMCASDRNRWIRFGWRLGLGGRWWFSGTNERSQYTEIAGDPPTHWMPLPPPPEAAP